VEFELTAEHIKLLRHSYVMDRLSDWETGAAEIDGKRPYGNSYVAADVITILGWAEANDEDEFPEELEDRAMALHSQTPIALQIVLSTGSFEPGLYRQPDPYRQGWERVDPA